MSWRCVAFVGVWLCGCVGGGGSKVRCAHFLTESKYDSLPPSELEYAMNGVVMLESCATTDSPVAKCECSEVHAASTNMTKSMKIWCVKMERK